jgi:uncharacterized membrane protein YcaP (DUF421 family)
VEVVVRAVVVYGFLWFVTRVSGRATLGELSTFQLLLYVTMGDLVQQAVTQQDYSITSAVLAVGVFALLTVGLSWVNARWPRARGLIHGTSVVVVRDGEPLLDAMRRELLSLDDLLSAAREQGVERFSAIRLAVLEPDGRLSFLTRGGGSSGAPDGPPAG